MAGRRLGDSCPSGRTSAPSWSSAAGPIVIGQACEFDYSGTQACRALKEGYRVILVNSNPATIMTDPEFANRTYIEPLVPDVLEAVIEASGPTPYCPPWAARPASTWP